MSGRDWIRRALREAFFSVYNPLKRLYWFVVRPKSQGANVIVLCEGKLLLVRTAFSRRWTFPGGKTDSGESPEAAALRELREEAGVALPAVEYLGFFETRLEYKRDTVYGYLGISTDFAVEIDGREIIDVGWFGRDELPLDRLARVDEMLSLYDTYLHSHE